MASKRKKRESSSSAQELAFDKNRFVSFEASQRYHEGLANKSLIPERGLLPDPEDGNMLALIRKWKWQQFTAQPEPAAVNIVKEFYANAKEAENNAVFVRGKWVKIGKRIINRYYGLHSNEFFGYSTYINEDLDYSEIVAALCEPGTDWRITATQEATNFPSAKLSRYGRAWFAFICAKMMPARHRTDVTKERAALLFCIAKEKTVDVGELIKASIKKTLEGSTSGGLPHPSLITDLCKLAGVKWDDDEVMQAPLAAIIHPMIARYKVWGGGISQPDGLGYMITASNPDAAGTSQHTTEASEIPGPFFIEELSRHSRHHSRRIDMVASKMDRAMKRINKKLDCIARRQDEMHKYNTSACTSLADIMTKMNPAFEYEPFPLPSKLQMYPPENLDDDEEDSEEDGTEEEDNEEAAESDN